MRVYVKSRSLCEFVAAGKQSVGQLMELVRPSSSATPEQEKAIARHIGDLDNESFETREKALHELEKLGDMALPALRKAQAEPPSLETGRRIERLLSHIDRASRQELRAIEVLERIARPEASDVLEALAKGAPDAQVTREAKTALARLHH